MMDRGERRKDNFKIPDSTKALARGDFSPGTVNKIGPSLPRELGSPRG